MVSRAPFFVLGLAEDFVVVVSVPVQVAPFERHLLGLSAESLHLYCELKALLVHYEAASMQHGALNVH